MSAAATRIPSHGPRTVHETAARAILASKITFHRTFQRRVADADLFGTWAESTNGGAGEAHGACVRTPPSAEHLLLVIHPLNPRTHLRTNKKDESVPADDLGVRRSRGGEMRFSNFPTLDQKDRQIAEADAVESTASIAP